MVQGIRVVLFPLQSILQFLGLNSFSIHSLQKSSIWQYYSLLLTLYLLFQYSVFTPKLLMSIKRPESNVSMFFTVVTSSFSEMMAAFFSLFMDWKMCDKKIKIISKLLKIEDNLFLLNMSIKYSKCQWHSRIFCCSCLMLFFFISDLLICLKYDPSRAEATLILRYSARFISWIDILYFLAIVKIIHLHFTRINGELAILATLIGRDSMEEVFLKINIICKMHKSLRKICKIHNHIYGLQFASLSIFFISVTTAHLYFIIIYSVYFFVKHEDIFLTVIYSYCMSWTLLYYVFYFLILDFINNAVEEVRYFTTVT